MYFFHPSPNSIHFFLSIHSFICGNTVKQWIIYFRISYAHISEVALPLNVLYREAGKLARKVTISSNADDDDVVVLIVVVFRIRFFSFALMICACISVNYVICLRLFAVDLSDRQLRFYKCAYALLQSSKKKNKSKNSNVQRTTMMITGRENREIDNKREKESFC